MSTDAAATIEATWNGTVIASSDQTIVVEGNHYFPPSSVQKEVLRPSDTHTTCSWKGEASYYTLDSGGEVNPDAAWFYPAPKEAAGEIRNYIAFWKGVKVAPAA